MTRALARDTDPGTAHEAAARVTPHVAQLENMVLGAVRKLGTATAHEVAAYLDLPLVSVSPRFAPLAARGLLERTGERRPTPGGASAQTWRAVKREQEEAAA
jgi:hypothetical protein